MAKRTGKKKGRKAGGKRAKTRRAAPKKGKRKGGKGKIPLKILQKRLVKLNLLVRARGGKFF